jgi:acyl-homoserine-lactone acylase
MRWLLTLLVVSPKPTDRRLGAAGDWRTPLGPVSHRDGGRIYVLRAAGEGEHRHGAQFLRMMRDARQLACAAERSDTDSRTCYIEPHYADKAGNMR